MSWRGVSRGNKYGNRKTVVEGITFDSQREADRYQELRLLERAGQIDSLTRQPKFSLDVNGVHVADYFADFQYRDSASGRWIIEDSKGMRTRVYIIKRKLVKAIHNVEIVEV